MLAQLVRGNPGVPRNRSLGCRYVGWTQNGFVCESVFRADGVVCPVECLMSFMANLDTRHCSRYVGLNGICAA